jgi:aminoglycoside/choline kinase family phosphotransferase
VLGAQRALRILGVFARLCLVEGKPRYLSLLPRVWGHLEANLRHPALAALAAECRRLLPPPTPATLARIARRCGRDLPR